MSSALTHSRQHSSTVASLPCRSNAEHRCLEAPMTAPDPSIELMRLINGYQVSQACGAHPASLYRLLRALASVGVFRETGNKEFSLTPLGVCLTNDALGSR